MATPQGPPRPPGPGAPIVGGRPLNPEEIEKRMTEEAQKHGLTLEQFKQIQMIQQKRLEAEAAKLGMSPQQFLAMQQQKIAEEAAKVGMSPQQFIEMKKKEAIEAQRAAQQAQQNGQPPAEQQQQGQAAQPGQPQLQRIDLNKPVEAKPDALAVAKFLRAQDLKCRTCIFDGQRRDMFKVKRAFRAFNSEAYKKARTKDPLLPPVTNEAEARTALQLLPLNMLALRVGKKTDADHNHGDHSHKPKKRVKGLWDVKIEGQQEFEPMMHYMWIYEAPSIKTRIYSILALIAVFAVVLFPLWPMKMRQGVWYLSVGMMGLLAAFFAMAIFRLILFCVTVVAVPPGLWLYPNLFEDVGFFDSFRPVWGWQETKKAKKKGGKKEGGAAAAVTKGVDGAVGEAVANGGAATSGADTGNSSAITKRHAAPTVEEADDE